MVLLYQRPPQNLAGRSILDGSSCDKAGRIKYLPEIFALNVGDIRLFSYFCTLLRMQIINQLK